MNKIFDSAFCETQFHSVIIYRREFYHMSSISLFIVYQSYISKKLIYFSYAEKKGNITHHTASKRKKEFKFTSISLKCHPLNPIYCVNILVLCAYIQNHCFLVLFTFYIILDHWNNSSPYNILFILAYINELWNSELEFFFCGKKL